MLIDGFDSAPAFMMTFNPPNFAELPENYGFSWVLESNSFSRGAPEKGGAKITKTYRLYDWES